MTLIKAAKQAREALAGLSGSIPKPCLDAYRALDQAIAAAEQQEPEAWMQESTGVIRSDWGFDKTGYVPLYRHPPKHDDHTQQHLEMVQQQEPVAWMWDFEHDEGAAFSTKEPTISILDGVNYVPLYTAPHKREWQGLTDEEAVQIIESFYGDGVDMLRSLEAKLKEKNT